MKRFKCPRGCGKAFETDSRVSNHLSQGECVQWQSEVLPLARAVRRGKRRRHRLPHEEFTWESDAPPDDATRDFQDADILATNPPPASDPATDLAPNGGQTQLQENLFTYHTEYYPDSGTVLKHSKTFIDQFNLDAFAKARRENIYYPFRDREEWGFAAFLTKSRLSISAIDELLSLPLIKSLKLTFGTAKTLRNRVEQLPRGPRWRSIPIQTRYPTKSKVSLYYRDPLKCIEAILQNPLLTDYISYSPMRVYRSAQRTVRVYSEWLTGSAAWEMQKELPTDATLLGIILSSDKTTITSMTGNRSAHPLLISLANLDVDFRAKSSNHAYLLLALLPIPKFIEKQFNHVLEIRLIHQALDFVMEPAKQAAKLGYMMEDAFGRCRYSFTGLAGYITDLPEAQLISCVPQSHSPMSQANSKQLGDPMLHARRTRIFTLGKISQTKKHPWDLRHYLEEARGLHVSAVHKPFWRNWGSPPLADPANFINPEPLHYWHKAFHAHDLDWCLKCLGDAELDFRYSVLHEHTNFRRFPDGISQLQQCTMREHRDLQRYIVPVIAGLAEPGFVIAIRALCDVRYRAQAPFLDDEDLQAIDNSLQEFHRHREAVVEAGARFNVDGDYIGWNIPKFETLLNITRLARSSGIPGQWSAERTENEHKTAIKLPSRKSNNQNYSEQLCRSMDREEKIRMFSIATEIRAAAIELRSEFAPTDEGGDAPASEERVASSTTELLKLISPTTFKRERSERDYFWEAEDLHNPLRTPSPGPLRTIVVHNTAIHVKKESCFLLTLEEAAQMFGINDLFPALCHYMERARHDPESPFTIGGRRRSVPQSLPFKRIKVWTRCQLQNKTFHPPYSVMPATTINASPPKGDWEYGRFDPVIININDNHQWPYSGLKGHCVAQVCLIILPVPNNAQEPLPPSFCDYLTYCRRFDIISQPQPPNFRIPRQGPFPESTTSLFPLRRARRTDTSFTGDIIPIQQLRSPANLVPKFGDQANPELNRYTSVAHDTMNFYLNKYFTKQMFYSLTIPYEHPQVD